MRRSGQGDFPEKYERYECACSYEGNDKWGRCGALHISNYDELPSHLSRLALAKRERSFYDERMKRSVARVRGLAWILWQSKHEFIHVLLGLVWAWFLREVWNELNPRWIAIAVTGSLLPDVEHFVYFLGHGKQDPYTKQIFSFLRTKQWRALTLLITKGHKHNTNLRYHNYYFMAFLFALSILSLFIDWNAGVVLFGAMLTHYCFDIIDDIVILGHVNPNWKRWGKGAGHTVVPEESRV